MPHLLPQISLKWIITKRGYSRNLLILRALQDGLGFKKMKSTETYRNYKKLIISLLSGIFEMFSNVKISPTFKNWVQIGCNF